MKLKSRKQIRLSAFDYSSNGAYFITICTDGRKNIFGTIEVCGGLEVIVHLSSYGRIVEQAILEIPKCYPTAFVDNYVVMPNHVHILLRIDTDSGKEMHVPTVSRIIQHMKGAVTKRLGKPVWQKSFYDEIARSDQDYFAYWNYIDGNPSQWFEDKYYSE